MPASWKLLDMRARIRLIDTQLIVLLSRRFEIMRDVRAYKKEMGLPLVDPQREREVLDHCLYLGESLGVPVAIIEELYQQLFEQVRGPMPSPALTSIKAGPPESQQNSWQSPAEVGESSDKR